MGPQSSGKSTLLNHVFGVRFDEMNADLGRSQTTKGVWLSRAASGGDDAAVPTLVMDLEGTDGRERGEDDTAFEKQTALFAMAAADVLLVNMWCNDIGREVASGKPLLKTIFQVNLKVFNPKKTTLLFVIRDKSRTPLEMLEANLREDLGAFVFTLVPIRPRRRCELHSLRTFSPGGRIIPPTHRFQSATPFNSASDAFQLRPEISLRIMEPPSSTLIRSHLDRDEEAGKARRRRLRRLLHAQVRRAVALRARSRGVRGGRRGAFYTLVPIRPRSRGERRSLRTFAGASLRPRPRVQSPTSTPFNSY